MSGSEVSETLNYIDAMEQLNQGNKRNYEEIPSPEAQDPKHDPKQARHLSPLVFNTNKQIELDEETPNWAKTLIHSIDRWLTAIEQGLHESIECAMDTTSILLINGPLSIPKSRNQWSDH